MEILISMSKRLYGFDISQNGRSVVMSSARLFFLSSSLPSPSLSAPSSLSLSLSLAAISYATLLMMAWCSWAPPMYPRIPGLAPPQATRRRSLIRAPVSPATGSLPSRPNMRDLLRPLFWSPARRLVGWVQENRQDGLSPENAEKRWS